MSTKYIHQKIPPTALHFLGGLSHSYKTTSLNEILEHEKKELLNAKKANNSAPAWKEFEYHLSKITENMPTNEEIQFGHHIYWLGYYANQLSQFLSWEEQIFAIDAQIALTKIKAPILSKNYKESLLRDAAQNLARMNWELSEHQNTKTSDMAEFVRNQLTAFDGDDWKPFKKLIPKSPAIKKWISPVAPEFAKKGGRPKKNKYA